MAKKKQVAADQVEVIDMDSTVIIPFQDVPPLLSPLPLSPVPMQQDSTIQDSRSFSGPPEATEQTTAASPTLRPTPVKRQKIHHQEQSEPEPESEQESVPDSDMEQVSDMPFSNTC